MRLTSKLLIFLGYVTLFLWVEQGARGRGKHRFVNGFNPAKQNYAIFKLLVNQKLEIRLSRIPDALLVNRFAIARDHPRDDRKWLFLNYLTHRLPEHLPGHPGPFTPWMQILTTSKRICLAGS
jgi:hypothetical protein